MLRTQQLIAAFKVFSCWTLGFLHGQLADFNREDTPMTTELYWMTLTVLMTALFWVPYILDRVAVRGLMPAISDTKPEDGGHHC